MDYFGGWKGGYFPYYSPEVYRANVQNLEGQISMNITVNFKVELFNMMRYDFEFNFVPLLAGGKLMGFTSSAVGDNCILMYVILETLRMESKMTKNVA